VDIFPPLELATRVVELGKSYGGALLAVERNNHGYGVLAHLRDQEYENIFEQDGKLGWLTSAASRPAMIENMVAVVYGGAEIVPQSAIAAGVAGHLCGIRTGTLRQRMEAHDDCVMAMAIALAVRRKDVGLGVKKEGAADNEFDACEGTV